jgi:tetratricopeptide (TPR) repeat protein
MRNSNHLLVLVFCSLLGLGGAVFATDTVFVADESDAIFGKGVHAFFDRDYEEAVKILSKVDELKTNDPRPYYFLGLANLWQDETEKADKFFKKAAELEYSGRALRHYAVSESLRRIQGEERLRLEKIREEERTNAQVREQRIREARYGSETTTAREKLLLSTMQGQKENVSTSLPANLGGNVFGVKPLDPTRPSEENIVARRADANPFGDISVNADEVLQDSVPAVTMPRNSRRPTTVAEAPAERVFVGVDGTLVQQETPSNQANTSTATAGVQATAKGVGRALGMLFSGKTNQNQDKADEE